MTERGREEEVTARQREKNMMMIGEIEKEVGDRERGRTV